MSTEPFWNNGVNWKRIGIVAGAVAALLAVGTRIGVSASDIIRAAGGATEADVQQLIQRDSAIRIQVEERERADQKQNRVLRCLMRFDPREGPAVNQCDGDPLKGQ